VYHDKTQKKKKKTDLTVVLDDLMNNKEIKQKIPIDWSSASYKKETRQKSFASLFSIKEMER
jgi:hypothetical protein